MTCTSEARKGLGNVRMAAEGRDVRAQQRLREVGIKGRQQVWRL